MSYPSAIKNSSNILFLEEPIESASYKIIVESSSKGQKELDYGKIKGLKIYCFLKSAIFFESPDRYFSMDLEDKTFSIFKNEELVMIIRKGILDTKYSPFIIHSLVKDIK